MVVALCLGGGVSGWSLHVTAATTTAAVIGASIGAGRHLRAENQRSHVAIFQAPSQDQTHPPGQRRSLRQLKPGSASRITPTCVLGWAGYLRASRGDRHGFTADKSAPVSIPACWATTDDTILNNYHAPDPQRLDGGTVKLAGLQNRRVAGAPPAPSPPHQRRMEVLAPPLVAVVLFFVFGVPPAYR